MYTKTGVTYAHGHFYIARGSVGFSMTINSIPSLSKF